ncbi:MAG: universal stress protein, partial [Micrococcales bacterium]|nr:universal stress protein [Micrococcales bacterium]
EALATAATSFTEASVPVRYEVVTARSAPAGLMVAAQQFGATILVCGSSADGPWGHIALGSVSDHLLHSSHIPIALAPRGQRYTPAQRVDRVTVAVDGSEASRGVLTRAAQMAGEVGARVRIVSFAVRTPTMYPPQLGLNIEDRVVAQWRHQADRIVADALTALDTSLETEPELHVSEGKSWTDVLEEPGWGEGDVLVIGSSSSEPRLARVFLGSTAARITRHSPVPVIVVP